MWLTCHLFEPRCEGDFPYKDKVVHTVGLIMRHGSVTNSHNVSKELPVISSLHPLQGKKDLN